jgi:uroporphyrinogen decarboxylase
MKSLNHSVSTLSGKELLFATLRHESTSVVPWVPFAGVHAGKLKGYSGREILTDPHKLLESLLVVKEVYDPDGLTVMFDLQVEAEILGCDLMWAEAAPPSVATHPLAQRLEVPTHLPEKHEGRLPLILSVMREMKNCCRCGDSALWTGNRPVYPGFPSARYGYFPGQRRSRRFLARAIGIIR